MLIFTRSLRVCLAVDPVDLRKSFENRGHPLKLSISLPLQWVSMISTFELTTNRIDLLKIKSGAIVAPNVDHGFHATTGLLDTVVADARTITYGYTASGATPTGTPRARTYGHSGSTLLYTEMPRNSRGLLDGVSHVQSSVPVLYQSMTYAYNVDRVTSITHGHEANMFWNVGYDSRGK